LENSINSLGIILNNNFACSNGATYIWSHSEFLDTA
jgi:hypothetical protein